MRVIAGIAAALLGQRGHLFAWTPVMLAAGIGLYFAAAAEPAPAFLWACFGMACLCVRSARRLQPGLSPLVWALALVLAGYALAGARAHLVAGPVLDWRYYGPVTGTVVGIDRSASDAPRITLADVELAGLAPRETPRRVRVSLHGQAVNGTRIRAGLRVILTGHLAPPSGPAEPGGFDFRRHAWFQKLGAVGYTRVPVLAIAPPAGQRLLAFRLRLADAVRARLPGETGAFAAAITTGDRSAIPAATNEVLRASNLAHLLAISGLHMGLLAGVVFAAVRLGLALIMPLALRLPVKKIAAGVALVAAAGYLALSGGNVATERAFVMAAVALAAVMVDRRVLSLRAVALAATIVLVLRPEALLGPGFQMSFAATTALVAVFGALRDHKLPQGPRWLRPAVAVALSSLVAGLATAPIAAAHFNRIAQFGLVANLAAVPVMGTVIAPSAVLAAVLAPLGLEEAGLWLMGRGLDWVLAVARAVSDLPGAVRHVPAPGGAVLPLLAGGALVVILWQGRARLVGLAPVCVAGLLWAGAERPDVLISDTGGLVGVMTEQGRALSRARGQGFVAGIWLENDGDGADQTRAASRWRGPAGAGFRATRLGQLRLVHVAGRGASAVVPECAPGDVVVMARPFEGTLPCHVLDARALRRTGAVALYLRADGPEMTTARGLAGARLWRGAAQ